MNAETLLVHGLLSLRLNRYCINACSLSSAQGSPLLMCAGMGKVGSYLQQLQDGLHGTLFIGSADESGARQLV